MIKTDLTKKQTCPICNSINDVIPIKYGLYYNTPKGVGKDFVLGGCIVSPDLPDWFCKKCQKSIDKIQEKS